MFYATVSDATIYIFVLLLGIAAYTDVKDFTIPNASSLSILILYPAFVIASGGAVDWPLSAGIAAVALIIGFFLFAMKYCGAGDVKLFAVVALWAGPELIVDFALLTTATGGFIAVSLWMLHRASFMVSFLPQELSCDSATFAKKPMPYGAAIAIGGVYVAFTLLR